MCTRGGSRLVGRGVSVSRSSTYERGGGGTTHVSFYLRTAGVAGAGQHMCRSTYERGGGQDNTCRSTYERRGGGRDNTCVDQFIQGLILADCEYVSLYIDTCSDVSLYTLSFTAIFATNAGGVRPPPWPWPGSAAEYMTVVDL